MGGCPSGAEGIRTQIPLSPLPLSGVGTEKWVGSIDSAPKGRVVLDAEGIGRVAAPWRVAREMQAFKIEPHAIST